MSAAYLLMMVGRTWVIDECVMEQYYARLSVLNM